MSRHPWTVSMAPQGAPSLTLRTPALEGMKDMLRFDDAEGAFLKKESPEKKGKRCDQMRKYIRKRRFAKRL